MITPLHIYDMQQTYALHVTFSLLSRFYHASEHVIHRSRSIFKLLYSPSRPLFSCLTRYLTFIPHNSPSLCISNTRTPGTASLIFIQPRPAQCGESWARSFRYCKKVNGSVGFPLRWCCIDARPLWGSKMRHWSILTSFRASYESRWGKTAEHNATQSKAVKYKTAQSQATQWQQRHQSTTQCNTKRGTTP